MRKRNTKGPIEFVMDNVFVIVMVWLWYRALLFKSLGTYSAAASRWILAALVLGLTVPGVLLQHRRQRNSFSVFVNTTAGFGVYTAAVYLPFRPKLIVITLVIAAAAAAVYAAMVFSRRVRSRQGSGVIVRRKFAAAGRGAHAAAAIGLTVIMAVLAVPRLWGAGQFTVRKSDLDRSEDWENITERQIADTLIKLEEDIWTTLSVQEKLDVLQAVADCERARMGIPHELTVGSSVTRERQQGYYEDAAHQIIIGLDHLNNDPSEEVLDTVVHEARHAYQHRLVDAYHEVSENSRKLYLFRNAAVLAEEFAHYESGGTEEEDWEYYYQWCEQDARDYSEQILPLYFAVIRSMQDTR